jgi:hypothetical protein
MNVPKSLDNFEWGTIIPMKDFTLVTYYDEDSNLCIMVYPNTDFNKEIRTEEGVFLTSRLDGNFDVYEYTSELFMISLRKDEYFVPTENVIQKSEITGLLDFVAANGCSYIEEIQCGPELVASVELIFRNS